MAEYRTIKVEFWTDPYIEELSVTEKLLYIYLFTNPSTDNIGLLHISRRRIAFETGMRVEDVESGIARLVRDGKVVESTCGLWLVKFVKNQTNTSPKLLASLKSYLDNIPDPTLKHTICLTYPHIFECQADERKAESAIPYPEEKKSEEKDGYPMDRVSIPYGYPIDTVSIPYPYGMDTVCIPSGEKEREEEREKEEEREEKDSVCARVPAPTPARADKKSQKDPKQTYGTNNRVHLTLKELEALEQEYGHAMAHDAIDFLDLHLEAKGKDPYKSHAAAIRKWVVDAVREKNARQITTQNRLDGGWKSDAQRRQDANMAAALDFINDPTITGVPDDGQR